MRRLIFTSLLIGLTFCAMAQTESRPPKGKLHKERPSIESMVPDLTASQKSRIDAVTSQSAKTIEGYKSQLKAVRDSIRSYMNTQEDKSAILFPLYDREAMLQSEISKEYYRTKVAVDKVLTPEQYKAMCSKMEKQRQKDPPQHKQSKDQKASKSPQNHKPKGQMPPKR